jgi:hypothetical protein
VERVPTVAINPDRLTFYNRGRLLTADFFESSQQPTWPQIMYRRRYTQESPILSQFSQPFELGVTAGI